MVIGIRMSSHRKYYIHNAIIHKFGNIFTISYHTLYFTIIYTLYYILKYEVDFFSFNKVKIHFIIRYVHRNSNKIAPVEVYCLSIN